MDVRHAICIAVDGLRASALGAYGNTWYPTPALDELASQSLVVDWLFCDSPSLDGFYEAVWRGRSLLPSVGQAAGTRVPSLLQELSAARVTTELITDDAWLADEAVRTGFSTVRRIDKPPRIQSAASVWDTSLAQVFAEAAARLQSWADSPAEGDSPTRKLLWLHARGMRGPWDAPLALRRQLLDDEDPPAPAYVEPPVLLATSDQDEILLYRAAYAAEAMALDECLGALFEAIDEVEATRETLVILVGCRGFALGEHGVLGRDANQLYGELLHVPCLVRVPGLDLPPRLSQLAHPQDLHATLAAWFGLDGIGHSDTGRSLLKSSDGADLPEADRLLITAAGLQGERVLRTRDWMLRSTPAADREPSETGLPGGVELFAKPDDRWEANEIASRRPKVVERMLAALAAIEREGMASRAAMELVCADEIASRS